MSNATMDDTTEENNKFPVLTALPIGQGNCYLLEVYDNNISKKLIFLALVDCGGDGVKNKNVHVKKSTEYLWKKMEERAGIWNKNRGNQQEKNYYLDIFLLTHQDEDHWSVLNNMLVNQYKTRINVNGNIAFENNNTLSAVIGSNIYIQNNYNIYSYINNKFQEVNDKDQKDKIEKILSKCEKKPPLIGQSYWGGCSYGKIANDFIKVLKVYSCKEPSSIAITGNNDKVIIKLEIEIANAKEEIANVKEEIANVHVLCHKSKFINVKTHKGTKINIKNASSAVTLWDFGDNGKFLFTGDATAHTMLEITKIFNHTDDKTNDNTNNSSTYQGAIMTAPHHGSDTTSEGELRSEDGKNDRENEDKYGILDEFLKKVQPAAIEISAGFHKTYNHPGENFVKKCLEYFSKQPASTSEDHWVCYYATTAVKKPKKIPQKREASFNENDIEIVSPSKNQKTKNIESYSAKTNNRKAGKLALSHFQKINNSFCFFKTNKHLFTNIGSKADLNSTGLIAVSYNLYQFSMIKKIDSDTSELKIVKDDYFDITKEFNVVEPPPFPN